jgi:N6-L-threonylcarbamoyladenine synthase
MPTPHLILGVESSCDEMAAAVLRDGREVLASRVHSQDALHRPYGGVVPELASRDHISHVSQVVRAALEEAGTPERALDAIAVTMGPGLLGSLLVGLSFAKALAYRLGLPVVGVHHLAGHLAAAELAEPELARPYVGLVVSGGHTALYRVEEGAAPKLLGETADDAVGEAFDKVAKLLGLPFPGGPALAKLAESGREDAFTLPRPRLGEPGYAFSYSGLKTAVARVVREREPLDEHARADLAASFEAAATDVLVAKARRALEGEALGQLAVVGGVAANQRLRRRLASAAEADGFRVYLPPPALCTDNAAMVAAAGARAIAGGERHDLDLGAFSRLPLASGGGARQGRRAPESR